jgi:hypothetical protein
MGFFTTLGISPTMDVYDNEGSGMMMAQRQ